MAGTQKPGDGQTQCLWPVGHNTEDRGCLQDIEPDGLFDTIDTRGEDHQICYSSLPNGNVSGSHLSSRWGTKGNPLHYQE